MRHLIIATALAAVAGPLAAQAPDCTLGHLPSNTHEAELFRIRGVSTVFARDASPMTLRPGGLIVALEATSLPDIDAATATPTYCRSGKPPEHVNLLPVLPRPRLIYGLADEFTLEVSWVPPVRVDGVKADLFGVALARTVPLASGLVSVRGHATFGEIRAPITCTQEQIADPAGPSECVGAAKPSDDHFKPNSFGADLTYGWPVGGGKLRPYVGAGVNRLLSRFQVDATDSTGFHYDQKVEGNYTRLALFGGASWYPTPRWGLTGELYADPGTKMVGRMGVAYGLK
ncbi:MAG TPA: hypothetical protein VFI13_13520 [Gemmatimonadales bacterium]|nr:hypothetical protein [Gemmatimonadales bacterium]